MLLKLQFNIYNSGYKCYY